MQTRRPIAAVSAPGDRRLSLLTSAACDSDIAKCRDPLFSDSSEEEDEFEWLRDRGANPIHDHWPSRYRSYISKRVNSDCVDEEVSFFASPCEYDQSS